MSLTFTYLALGDSYTIGEGVPLHESYPYQVVQMLRASNMAFLAPEVIAKTGWTTSELAAHIDHTILNPIYDFVSLLIGVNNQYRGIATSHYEVEFEELLTRSISLADNNASRVFVLSIPDWGRSPFAKQHDGKKITSEIAFYNKLNLSISRKYKVNYVDITRGSFEYEHDANLFCDDGLHPSGKTYKTWAEMLSQGIRSKI